MELQRAKELANEILHILSPYCERIDVAGSIRRNCPFVHDIDIVLIQRDPWGLISVLKQWGTPVVKGSKIERVPYKGVMVDIYFATRETWATLLLIRTGSKENNIRLCTYARDHGMKLHANGSGLFKIWRGVFDTEEGKEVRIAGDTEFDIYKALGLPYQKPEERK